MQQLTQQLWELIAPVITAMGYELVGVEYLPNGGDHGRAADALLRVYIDKQNGIDVDDCQRVSHQLSGLLDVEDPIRGEYTLEISSPGIERPLFIAEHYQRFAGHKARLQLHAAAAGKRKLTGLLKGMQGPDVVLDIDGSEQRIPLDQIDKARLVPDFSISKGDD